MPAAKETTTVRITREAHAKLCTMAEEDGVSLTEALGRLIEAQRRKRLFDQADKAYAALREDEEAWSAFRQEIGLWENTLMDGLNDLNDAWSKPEAVEEDA